LSLNAAVERIGPRVDVPPATLRSWFKRMAIDTGQAPGTTTEDAARIREFEREVQLVQSQQEIGSAAMISQAPIGITRVLPVAPGLTL
jgi:transposase